MKRKISITLPSHLLRHVDELAGTTRSRSVVIEQLLRNFLQERSRRKVHARDLSRINRAASRLNHEAADVLTYQT